MRVSPRATAVLVLALGAGAALRVGVEVAVRRAEKAVARRIVAEAARRGLTARVGRVTISPERLAVRVEGLSVERPGTASLELGWATARFGLAGHGLLGRWRTLETGEGRLTAPGGVEAGLRPWLFRVDAASARDVTLQRPERADTIRLRAEGGALELTLREVRVSDLARVRRAGRLVGDPGRVSGLLRIAPVAGGGLAFEVNVRTRGLRIATAAESGDVGEELLGPPTDVVAAASGTLFPDARFLDLACGRLEAEELRATGTLVAAAAPEDLWLDLSFEVERLDLARLLATSGLELPAGATDLGSAAATAEVTGRMRDPSSIEVTERLDFRRPAVALPALEKLKGPFVHEAHGADGTVCRVLVGPASPDFVPLADVPPLFVRALLLSEDANFRGHPGIDLTEIPVAMAINWVRGTRARGASTITQQLAKNLFLSREKSYGRKLQEAALALLLDSTLGKDRILEIYLNVIEWGPGVFGLGAASRHYFGKEPAALSPKEMAFLVALIPGPIKYQRSIASGTPTRGFASLVTGVLARLRSVDALSETEYEQARAEPVVLPWTPRAEPPPAEPAAEPGPDAPEGPEPEPPALPTPAAPGGGDAPPGLS